MSLEEKAHCGDFAEAFGRQRLDLEPTLPLCHDEPLRAEPVEDLPQGAHARPVADAHRIKLELLPWRKPPEDDVLPHAAVDFFPDRVGWYCVVAHLSDPRKDLRQD